MSDLPKGIKVLMPNGELMTFVSHGKILRIVSPSLITMKLTMTEMKPGVELDTFEAKADEVHLRPFVPKPELGDKPRLRERQLEALLLKILDDGVSDDDEIRETLERKLQKIDLRDVDEEASDGSDAVVPATGDTAGTVEAGDAG